MPKLSSAEMHHFRQMGYLRISAGIDSEVIERMRSVILSGFENKIAPYRTNANGDIARLDQLLDRDAIFIDTLRSQNILDPLISLLGKNIEVTKYRHNHATRNAKGDIPFRLHRDIQNWSRSLVAIFIYLENSEIENGCTHIVPGSHLLPCAGPQSNNGGGNWADEHEDYEFMLRQSLPVPVAKGDVLLIDCLTFHSVGKNLSSSTRMSVVFACHSVDDIYRTINTTERVLLCGNLVYKGTDVLMTSGSLNNPR